MGDQEADSNEIATPEDLLGIILETFTSPTGNAFVPTMSPEPFLAGGYLQEANRRFFHPLRLSISLKFDEESGEVVMGPIYDGRQDPEGIRFDRGGISKERALKIDREWEERTAVRMSSLGYMVQPIE